MPRKDTDRIQLLLHNIDEALVQNSALTDKQLKDVRRLRAELQEHARSGKLQEAKQCEKLALRIIREGAPAQE